MIVLGFINFSTRKSSPYSLGCKILKDTNCFSNNSLNSRKFHRECLSCSSSHHFSNPYFDLSDTTISYSQTFSLNVYFLFSMKLIVVATAIDTINAIL
jgi:hypothetical protein